jgi:integrase/recombinase XerD
MSIPTTSIFYNKYKERPDGKCPVSIRVTYQRKKKYYPTIYQFTLDEWERMNGSRPRKTLKEALIKLQKKEQDAIKIIKELSMFSWEAFEKKYLAPTDIKSLVSALNNYAVDLRKNKQIGNAVTYECAANSISNFKDVKLYDVTPDFLKKYDLWMLENGRSLATIGIYARCIRSVINKAISANDVLSDSYPFGLEKNNKYEIPTGGNTKKALPLADIARIYNYEAKPGSSLEMARDFWFFIYYCNGLNTKDICLLRYKDIKGEMLEFKRAKTARTKRNSLAIRVPLLEDVKEIIGRWGQPKKSPETYIFPILKEGISAERERQLIQQFTHVINDHLKTIAKDLKFENLTTYVARHSFATVLKRSGKNVEFISEALGHSNIKTTQDYLAAFEDETKIEAAQDLIAFKTNKLKAV